MKKMVFALIFSLFLIRGINAGFCCKDPNTGQEKCWDYGECCNGFWYISCHDFTISVSGPNVFRVGQKTPVTVYIENTGAYSDSYTLTYEVRDCNPDLVQVDMTGADQITNLGPGEIGKVYPRITVLASTVTGTVRFNATSTKPETKYDDLLILESDVYLSLPEFSGIYFIQLSLLIGIIYFLKTRNYF